MKKIIIFSITAIIIISIFALITGARDEINYTYVLEFEQTTKAYPLMNSVDDCIGFKSYYEANNMHLYTFGDTNYENVLYIDFDSNEFIIQSFVLSGMYPNFDYTVSINNYSDIGFVYSNDDIYIYGFANGSPELVTNFKAIDSFIMSVEGYVTDKNSIREGYSVQFPAVPVPTESENIITPIIDSIGGFVLGIGRAIPTAFTALFMVDDQLNALSIFLLVLFGFALAYGCIRWITSLFRKET